MDWYNFCKTNFNLGIATLDNLKIYVAKGKITAEQYKEITRADYVAVATQ
ncbi:XkdX family protein [Clostridium sp.]|nr:XkdX family protein [Clostridium sp.]